MSSSDRLFTWCMSSSHCLSYILRALLISRWIWASQPVSFPLSRVLSTISFQISNEHPEYLSGVGGRLSKGCQHVAPTKHLHCNIGVMRDPCHSSPPNRELSTKLTLSLENYLSDGTHLPYGFSTYIAIPPRNNFIETTTITWIMPLPEFCLTLPIYKLWY